MLNTLVRGIEALGLGDPLVRMLPPGLKARLKNARNTFLYRWERFFAVDPQALRDALSHLGLRRGDAVYVRSSFDELRSIRATPLELVELVCDLVGEMGLVTMPTYPMSGLSQEYLDRQQTFDWRRTPSRSGLLTEIFRRMAGTERSLHPTHPLAARGVRARWLTDGHERSVTPFDEHSPYPRLLELNAWILNLGHFEAMTLRHFADHLIQECIPYPIYSDRRVTVRARAKDGREHAIVTRAHNPALGCDYRLVLERMRRDRILLTARVARVPVSMVRIQPCMEAYRRYYEEGEFRHFLKPLPPPGASGC